MGNVGGSVWGGENIALGVDAPLILGGLLPVAMPPLPEYVVGVVVLPLGIFLPTKASGSVWVADFPAVVVEVAPTAGVVVAVA